MEIGLGAAALAFPVLESIKHGCEFFADAARMPKDCEALHLRLLLEYSRLIDWADFVGLSDKERHADYDIKYTTNRAQMYAALAEIEERIQTLRGIENRYTEQIDAGERRAQSRTGRIEQPNDQYPAIAAGEREVFTKADQKALNELKRSLASPNYTARRKHFKAVEMILHAARAIKQVFRHPKGLLWRAVDKRNFETNLLRLSELTNFLHASMGDAIQRHLLENFQDSYMAVLDIAGDVNTIKTALGSLQALPTAPPLSNLMERLTLFKLQHRQISAKPHFDRSVIELDAETIHVSYNANAEKEYSSSRNLATIGESRVWVEWKRYREVGEPAPKTILRVQQLASLLKTPEIPAEFHIPACRGYFLDTKYTRFGFVYDFGPASTGTAAPSALKDLLGGQAGSLQAWSFPSKVHAALRLASSILYLHAAGWLHKDLKSANIVLTTGHGDKNGCPSICISGFENSRPEDEGTSTMQAIEDNVYCHPDYQLRNHGYKRSYDFYSLGIILIELAHWQTASTISGLVPDGATRADGSRVTTKDCILHDKGILDVVRQQMGPKYTQAVEACIKGVGILGIDLDLDEADETMGDLLQRAFVRHVVDNLASIAT